MHRGRSGQRRRGAVASAGRTVRSAPPWMSSSGTGSTSAITRTGSVAAGIAPDARRDAAEASARRPAAGTGRRSASGSGSRPGSEVRCHRVRHDGDDPRTRRVDGRGRSVGDRGRRPPGEPSPRTTTAAIATIPPIDDPTSATRRIPRSPSQSSAPATSSISSSPNVVRASSEPPCPRKSRPRTPAVRRSVRSELDEVRRDRAGPAVEEEDRLVRVGSPVVACLRGQPPGLEANAVARAEAHDLAAEARRAPASAPPRRARTAARRGSARATGRSRVRHRRVTNRSRIDPASARPSRAGRSGARAGARRHAPAAADSAPGAIPTWT